MSIISQIEQRSRLENPAIPISSPNILEAIGLYETTPAGIQITQDKALGITAFWNGVQVLSQTVASLPFEAFQKSGNTRKLAPEHNVYSILHIRPNPLMTPFTFKEQIMRRLLTWGNFYAEIERSIDGRPMALWPLLPDRTYPVIKDRQKSYVTEIEEKRLGLPGHRILHIPGVGYDGYVGYNVIRMHRDSLGLSVAANEYGARFFGNSARPSGYLKHPGKPGADERLQMGQEWQMMHGGLSQAQRTAVLWGGMEFKELSLPPEDAQFLQTRSFQIEEVCRILNINPILLQHHEKATTWGSGIAQFLTAFAKFTITPWLDRIEDVVNWDLFSEKERRVYYSKFNIAALLRGDPDTQANILEKKLRSGVISQDEWRELDDENPLPDGLGKHYYMPLNMSPIDAIMERPSETLPTPLRSEKRSLKLRQRHRNVYKPLFLDGANRITRRDVQNASRAIEKAFASGKDTLVEFNRWIDEFYPNHRRVIYQTMVPIISAYAEVIASDTSDDISASYEDIQTFAKEYTETFAMREINSSIGQLRGMTQTISIETLQESLLTRVGEWSETRPLKIAEREIVAVAAGATRYVFQQNNMGMIWRASPNACPICKEMDGKRIGSKDYFLMPGENVSSDERPGGLSAQTRIGGPPLHEGCACDIIPD